MADAPRPTPARRWPSRRFALLGIALPILAFVVLAAMFSTVPRGRHVVLSDAHTAVLLAAIAAVPLASIAGIVLSVVAFVRARRERAAGMVVGHALGVVAVLVSLVSIALLALLVWAALQGLASFR